MTATPQDEADDGESLEELIRRADEAVRKQRDAAEKAAKAAQRRRLEGEIEIAQKADAGSWGVRGRDWAPLFLPSGAIVVVRRPRESTFKKYRAAVMDAKGGVELIEAARTFIDSCRLHPDPQEFGKLESEAPGLTESTLAVAQRLAEVDEQDLMGKAASS